MMALGCFRTACITDRLCSASWPSFRELRHILAGELLGLEVLRVLDVDGHGLRLVHLFFFFFLCLFAVQTDALMSGTEVAPSGQKQPGW